MRKSSCTGTARGMVRWRRQIVLWGTCRQQACGTSLMCWRSSIGLPSLETTLEQMGIDFRGLGAHPVGHLANVTSFNLNQSSRQFCLSWFTNEEVETQKNYSKWQSLPLNGIVWLPSPRRGGPVVGGKSSPLSLPSGHPTSNAPFRRLSPRLFYVPGDGIYLTSECCAPTYQQWPHGVCLQAFHPILAGLAKLFTGHMDKLN